MKTGIDRDVTNLLPKLHQEDDANQQHERTAPARLANTFEQTRSNDAARTVHGRLKLHG
ncbi:MAG: hypothetical protein R2845_04305 [Thermomicrobiales bacterium]